jgi:hypothetical protein
MKYLVDADVLSEATRPSPDPDVVAWLSAHERELAVDPIVLGELYAGILALPAGSKRTKLDHWFDALSRTIVCLPWDLTTGKLWAKLLASLRKKGTPVPLLDGMVAATALAHGLTVATRNVKDFARTGVRVFNPFA